MAINSRDEKTFGLVRFIPVSQGPETVTGGEKLKLVKTELKRSGQSGSYLLSAAAPSLLRH